MSALADHFALVLRSHNLQDAFQREYRFHPTRKWRFDFADVKHRIAVEIDGGVWVQGRHTRGSGFVKDAEKLNEAAALGFRILRYTSKAGMNEFHRHYKEIVNNWR